MPQEKGPLDGTMTGLNKDLCCITHVTNDCFRLICLLSEITPVRSVHHEIIVYIFTPSIYPVKSIKIHSIVGCSYLGRYTLDEIIFHADGAGSMPRKRL